MTTTTTDLTKAQLAAVLGALDDQPRHPANREAALKAIGRSAERLGLTAAEVLAATAGLLDGRFSADEWRAELCDQADPILGSSPRTTLARAHRAAVVPDEAPEERAEAEAVDDGAATADAADDRRPEQAGAPPDGAAPAAAAEGVGIDAGADAAPDAAGGTDADDHAGTEATPDSAAPAARPPRAGTKQALLIDLLRRPEGATIDELVAATGWQRHTVRGAIAGALKKKLGLTVTATRVRAVGPNQTGGGGGGTVCRVVS